MRKQEYKEQEQPRRYYFFDYLFWLGEMAQLHYKGEPNRPDGDSMLMLCIMVVVLGPMLTIVFWTLSKILCKWKQDSVISSFLYLDSVFKDKHKLVHNQAPV